MTNTSTRCESMSRRGRCRRMTKDPSKKCHQHRDLCEATNEALIEVQSEVQSEAQTQVESTQIIEPSRLQREVIDLVEDDSVEATLNESEIRFSEQVPSVFILPVGVQCEGTTRSGAQCAKVTLNTTKRCHLHKVENSVVSFVPSSTTQPVVSGSGTQTLAPRPRRTHARFNQMVERLHEQVRQLVSRSRLQEHSEQEHSEQESTGHSTGHSTRHVVESTRHVVEPSHKEPRPKTTRHSSSPKKCSGKTEECCVCYDPVPEEEFLECDHPVCKNCIGQLRDTRCPMCRAEIKSKNISDKEKKKMIRRRQEDHRNRNNELFQNYIQSQNQITPVFIPLENIHSLIAHITL